MWVQNLVTSEAEPQGSLRVSHIRIVVLVDTLVSRLPGNWQQSPGVYSVRRVKSGLRGQRHGRVTEESRTTEGRHVK